MPTPLRPPLPRILVVEAAGIVAHDIQQPLSALGCEPCGQARVLLADDNAVNREIALAMLQAMGLGADSAADGLEAVRLAQGQRYDLVLMDMQMPHMSGLDATRAIRALPGWQTTPILALTANASDEDRRACTAAGMNDFIAKPMAMGLFCAALLRWLDRGAGPAAAATALAPPRRVQAPVPVPVPAAPDEGQAADGQAQDVLTRLASTPGHQLARGLAAVLGRSDKYLALLRKFVDLHAADMTRLASHLAAADHAAAQRLLHTLHGVAATLGADQIADNAAVLDELLRLDPTGRHLDAGQAAEIQAIRDGFIALQAALAPAGPAALAGAGAG